MEEAKPTDDVTPELKLHYEDKRKFAADYPRLISLNGFRKLFEITGQHSTLKRTQNLMQNEIMEMKKEIETMKKRSEDINNHAEFLHTEALDKLDEYK